MSDASRCSRFFFSAAGSQERSGLGDFDSQQSGTQSSTYPRGFPHCEAQREHSIRRTERDAAVAPTPGAGCGIHRPDIGPGCLCGGHRLHRAGPHAVAGRRRFVGDGRRRREHKRTLRERAHDGHALCRLPRRRGPAGGSRCGKRRVRQMGLRHSPLHLVGFEEQRRTGDDHRPVAVILRQGVGNLQSRPEHGSHRGIHRQLRRVPPAVLGREPPILPLALDKRSCDALLAEGGTDEWSWDAEWQALTPGSDGIPEASFYPTNTGAIPGNFGAVSIGRRNNSTRDLRGNFSRASAPMSWRTMAERWNSEETANCN